MSFDCKYKMIGGQCHRLKKECNPGEKGCILYGKFEFPFKDEEKEKEKEKKE